MSREFLLSEQKASVDWCLDAVSMMSEVIRSALTGEREYVPQDGSSGSEFTEPRLQSLQVIRWLLSGRKITQQVRESALKQSILDFLSRPEFTLKQAAFRGEESRFLDQVLPEFTQRIDQYIAERSSACCFSLWRSAYLVALRRFSTRLQSVLSAERSTVSVETADNVGRKIRLRVGT